MPAGLGEALLQKPDRPLDCSPQDVLWACLSGLRFAARQGRGLANHKSCPSLALELGWARQQLLHLNG